MALSSQLTWQESRAGADPQQPDHAAGGEGVEGAHWWWKELHVGMKKASHQKKLRKGANRDKD